ncbi:MAG: ATP-binding protein [Planctomycetota bacterium]
MKTTPRLYDTFLADHFARHRQMAFVGGPRQVGKTTTCRVRADRAVNWDDLDDRRRILAGPRALVETLELNRLTARRPVLLLDELHKFPRWKNFLKGFFDSYSDRAGIIVTGSSRLDLFRRGGDSLMGRYLPYRMHPLSVAELADRSLPDPKRIVRRPKPIPAAAFAALWTHGGFPEPFLKRDARFSRRWQQLRLEQLVREDLRDLTQIQQFDQLETLAHILAHRSAHQLIYGSLAGEVLVAVDTVRRWIGTLRDLHLGFLVRPWFKNVSRSLRKEPKWFLRDWAGIADPGDRAETFVGCHLLKAVEGWTDLGLGRFELGYLRDKEKREVDFVVVRDGRPWFLCEVKLREDRLGGGLEHFQRQLKAPFSFQVVLEAPYVARDCFAAPGRPWVVPAKTLLSQLL